MATSGNSLPALKYTSFSFDFLQAAKQYEKHVAANGKPDSHAEAKELMYDPSPPLT